MFLFGLGTVPLMLLTGVVFSSMKGKTKILINKIASVLIFVLSIIMLNRGLLSLNIDLFKNNNYKDIIVQKDIPVKIIINASKDKLTGCNNELIILRKN